MYIVSLPCKNFMNFLEAPLFPIHELKSALITINVRCVNFTYNA
jgi:hypothetical protein